MSSTDCIDLPWFEARFASVLRQGRGVVLPGDGQGLSTWMPCANEHATTTSVHAPWSAAGTRRRVSARSPLSMQERITEPSQRPWRQGLSVLR